MNYTSIEQSKKLLELGLSVKTADMVYLKYADSDNPAPRFDGCAPIILMDIPIDEIDCETLPCWSLGALLEIMPKSMEVYCPNNGVPDEIAHLSLYYDTMSESFVCEYTFRVYYLEEFKTINADTLFEVASSMVVWLLENGYIKKGGII